MAGGVATGGESACIGSAGKLSDIGVAGGGAASGMLFLGVVVGVDDTLVML